MRLGDPLGDGEAQPHAWPGAGAGTGLVGPPEAVKNVGQVSRRHAYPAVAHPHHHRGLPVLQLKRHRPARRRVLDGVGREVEEHLANSGRLHCHDDRLGGHVGCHRHATCLRQHPGGLGHIEDQGGEVGGLEREGGAPLVGTREREEVLDQLVHLVELFQRFVQCGDDLGRSPRVGERALHAGAKHHQRCLQFVARVGSEAVQPIEALFEARQHAVDGESEPRDFVVAERDCQPPVEAPPVLDGIHFIHQPAHRPQRVAREPVCQEHGQQDHQR